ncbi:DUF4225 domain-containing protein [Erwiniaceae bacterium CAU 1747]
MFEDHEYFVYEQEEYHRNRQLNELEMHYSDILYQTMNRVADSFLKWSLAKDRFIMEVMGFMRNVQERVRIGDISREQGVQLYREEIDSLNRQQQELLSKQRQQFIVVHKDELEKTLSQKIDRAKLVIAGIGFIGGGLQIVGGLAMIETGAGAVMLAHGFNNVIENGYFILYREDFVGPVRFVYHGVGKLMGINEKKSDAIYATVDLTLSVTSMLGMRLEPDIERLYRYIDADLLIGLKKQGVKFMRGGEITMEVVSDLNTFYSYDR